MEDERLEFLLNRYFDQALSAEEKRELECFLLESSSARATFWKLARWHGAIRQWGQEEWGRRDALEQVAKTRPPASPPQFRVLLPIPSQKPPQPAASPHFYRIWWPLAAAAAMVHGFFGWIKWQSLNPSQMDNSGIAVLTHASSAVWADESFAHENGEALRPGWLKLKSGALQVEFSRGARVVLEGPAEFELLSDNSGALRRGKLFATVPVPAHGFSVRASSFCVIDYGTQFGCVVPLVGPPEVHVFRGAVGLETAARAKEELRANQAVRLPDSGVQEIPANLDAFITEEKLVRLENDNARVRLAAWRQSNPAFSRHPGMLVHFDFERDGSDGTLINRAPNAPAETNAVITGCNWIEGRWPGKSALEFQGSRDRARLSLQGEYPQMTFLAWVRADHLPFGQNSLLKAASEEKLGEAGWYIFRDGALGWTARIAPRGAAEQWRHVNSAPVFRADGLGSWRLVATVFDGATVTHYFDGKVVGTDPVRLPTPLRLGRFDIGNWDGASDRDAALPGPVVREMVGNFFGCIDELAILSVPLSTEEIQRLYEEGRPVEE